MTTLVPRRSRSGAGPASADLPGAGPLDWTMADGAAVGAATLGDLYRSPMVADSERRLVLQPAWSLVTSTTELTPGRYLTAEPGGAPVVVLRLDDGSVRAFHNLCRHRGMPLAEGCGDSGRHLTCPYHQWSFGLDGALVRIPQHDPQFAGVDLAGWGLHPVAVAEWHGMIFANPAVEPAAGPGLLDVALEPLSSRLGPWWADGSAPLQEVAVIRYEVNCNWKLLIENHLDVYHLWYLHQRSLAAYDHRAFRWRWEGDTWWSHEPLRASESIPAGLDGLSDEVRSGIGAHLLFPNLMIVTTGEYLATYDAVPVAPDRTRLTLRVRSAPDADVEALLDGIRSFLDEDIAGCERLQAATGSPRFELGPLAVDHEAPLLRFHQALRRRLVP